MANVNVNEVKLCPNKECGVPLPTPEPEKCLSCGSLLRSPENKYFGTPDYLTMQLSDHLGRAEEELKKEPPALAKATNEIKTQYMAWLKVMPSNDMVAGFRDVKAILQHLIMSDVSLSSYGFLIKLAKEIGELGKAMDEYVKAGGQITNFEHLLLPLDLPKPSSEDEPNT